jgi:ParB/RepB/Spo0J family partition protein
MTAKKKLGAKKPAAKKKTTTKSKPTVVRKKKATKPAAVQDLQGTMQVMMLDPHEIIVSEGFNPRFIFDEDRMEELSAHVSTKGVLDPIVVRADSEGKHVLVDGERRLRAALKARVKQMPAVVEHGMDDTQALLRALTSNHADPLKPLEEATAYKRLKDSGMSAVQISKHVGRNRNHIAARLALLDADPALHDAMQKGKISATAAQELAQRTGKEEQKDALDRLIGNGKKSVSTRQVKDASDGRPNLKKMLREIEVRVANEIADSVHAYNKKRRKQKKGDLLPEKDFTSLIEHVRKLGKKDRLMRIAFAAGAMHYLGGALGRANARKARKKKLSARGKQSKGKK